MTISMHDTDSTRNSQVPPPTLGATDWLSQLHNDNVSVGGLADKNAGVGNMAEKATRPGIQEIWAIAGHKYAAESFDESIN